MSVTKWLTLSLALNVLGLLLGAWAIDKLGGWRYLGHRLHTHDAWPAYTQRESQLALLPIDSGAVVLLGDSHVANGQWDEWLPGRQIANRGIPGAAVSHVAAFAKTLDLSQASAVVLQVGTNDLLFHEPPDVRDAYAGLLDQLSQQMGSLSRVIICTLPGVNDEVRWTGIDAGDVAALNRDIVEEAFTSGIRPILLSRALGTTDGVLPPHLTDDGVHLRGEGYHLWASALAEALPDGTTLAD